MDNEYIEISLRIPRCKVPDKIHLVIDKLFDGRDMLSVVFFNGGHHFFSTVVFENSEQVHYEDSDFGKQVVKLERGLGSQNPQVVHVQCENCDDVPWSIPLDVFKEDTIIGNGAIHCEYCDRPLVEVGVKK